MSVHPSTTRVGFIGLGIMGAPIAWHLLRAGYRLNVFTRTRRAADALVEQGARWCEDPAAVASESDVVFTIVGFPSDVEAVYLGAQGLVDSARPGSFLVDMTTSSPGLWRRIVERAERRGVHCLDAPVTGGELGAQRGDLRIFVGGAPAHLEALERLFACFGKPSHQGPAGSGQRAKLANQIAIAGAILGVAEALWFAERAQLDRARLLESFSSGAAASAQLTFAGPRILAGDFSPGFYVKHFLKDLTLAIESAAEVGLDLAGVALVREQYRKLAELGHGNLGTQALFLLHAGT